MRWLISLLLLGLLGLVQAISSSGSRLLVVLEESEKPSFSQFWTDLEGRGYDLAFESPKSEKIALFTHGELAYDHLLLTPPKTKGFGPSLTPKIILDFVNAGGNVVLALSASSSTPSAITSLLLELDIHTAPDRNSVVVDHFNYDATSASDNHDVLLVSRPNALRPDVKNFFGGSGVLALPHTVGQTLGNTSPLLAPILTAPETAYTYNPKEDAESGEDLFATGKQLSLVSAMQARNSARFTVLGSFEMLQDRWFDASVKGPAGNRIKTVNREFAQQLTGWTFKETGVLKVGSINHYLTSDAVQNTSAVDLLNPDIYRIKNDVTFEISLSEYSHTHWVPFTVPSDDDLQLEFTMLSPFHRLPLHPISQTANSTLYSTSFTLPDQHGIFTFRVNYKRPFLSNVDEKRTVTVRHYAHNEWPRSWKISGGWVWIAGLWSVIGGFIAFVGLWLYCESPKREGEKK
ncbi:putative dolichyl-di-phosphooligosaccharide-protein glycotransferase [Phaeomoniella chlamydospora]|uniref:Dolichyl-diphosphooligosaccharide--protein glycosyltransferase subunit WBP1 n=1 Tax=Phaeomoniella chlamydospora TaxID=158046 RepID=A0A0G2E0X1_PHACM|nr:putative dolichyl-di-phosphooligosaccharide-protein glycotransferase [Phaeomoniella chlamydospora]